jgi:hypothetical protein
MVNFSAKKRYEQGSERDARSGGPLYIRSSVRKSDYSVYFVRSF